MRVVLLLTVAPSRSTIDLPLQGRYVSNTTLALRSRVSWHGDARASLVLILTVAPTRSTIDLPLQGGGGTLSGSWLSVGFGFRVWSLRLLLGLPSAAPLGLILSAERQGGPSPPYNPLCNSLVGYGIFY